MALTTVDEQPAFQPLIQQGPPEQTAPANLVPFVAPDTNIAQYEPGVVQQQSPQPLSAQQQEQAQPKFIDDSALLDKVQKGAASIGWQPTALAVMAALSGNFGPAMMLEEQKRKTSLIGQAVPVVAEINRRINSGAPEKALDLMEKAAAALGPRSPELAAYFQKNLERLSTTEQERGSAELKVKALIARAADIKRDTGQDAPYSNWLPILKHLSDQKQPGSAKAIESLFKEITQRQVMKGEGNQYNLVSQFGEPMVSQQAPIGVSESSLHNPPGYAMAQAHEMDTTSLTNAMNGLPYTYKGQQMPGSPLVANLLRRELSQQQGIQGQIEIGKNISVSPDWNDAAIRENIPPERIVSKQLTPEEANRVFDRALQSGAFRNSAMLRELENVPIASANVGKNIIDMNTGQLHPTMTMKQANADPDKAILSDKQIDQAQTVLTLNRRLPLLNDLIKKLPNNSDLLSRLSSFVDREANQRLGFAPTLTGQQVLQAVVKDSIERYANSQGVPAARYDYITRELTDSSANKQGALAAIASFNSLMSADKEALLKQGKTGTAQQPAQQSQQSIAQPGNLPTYTDMGIDPATAYAINRNEGSKAGSISPKGALHEWQVTLPTAERYNFTEAQWRNPDNSRNIAGTILQDLERQFPGRPDLVLAAYFSGPGNIDKKTMTIIDPAIDDGTKNKPGKTVQEYVNEGMARYNQYKAQQQGTTGQTAQPTQVQAQVQPPTAASTLAQAAAYRAQQQGLPTQQSTQGTGTQPIPTKPGKPVGKIIW